MASPVNETSRTQEVRECLVIFAMSFRGADSVRWRAAGLCRRGGFSGRWQSLDRGDRDLDDTDFARGAIVDAGADAEFAFGGDANLLVDRDGAPDEGVVTVFIEVGFDDGRREVDPFAVGLEEDANELEGGVMDAVGGGGKGELAAGSGEVQGVSAERSFCRGEAW